MHPYAVNSAANSARSATPARPKQPVTGLPMVANAAAARHHADHVRLPDRAMDRVRRGLSSPTASARASMSRFALVVAAVSAPSAMPAKRTMPASVSWIAAPAERKKRRQAAAAKLHPAVDKAGAEPTALRTSGATLVPNSSIAFMIW